MIEDPYPEYSEFDEPNPNLEHPSDEEVQQALSVLTDSQLLAALGEAERLRDMVVAEMEQRRRPR